MSALNQVRSRDPGISRPGEDPIAELRYQHLIEALPQIVWVSDTEGRLLHCNRHWYEYSGTLEQGVLDESIWAQIVHPEDYARILPAWRRHLESGEPWQFEYRLRRASDGAYRWHHARYLPVRDETGAILNWVGTAFDIQDVHLAREERSLLSAVVQSTDDAVVTKSLEGIVTSWNRGAERVFGYTAEEMIGSSISKLLPPGRQNEIRDILARIRRGERIDHFETQRRHKDGRILQISLSISPLHDSAGEVIGASSIKRDISERHRLDELVREREQRFRLMADSVPHLVWTSDPEGNTTYYNQRWKEYAALEPDATFTLQHWARLVHPDDAAMVERESWAAVQGGKGYRLEYRLRRLPNWPYRWHISRAVPVLDSEGRVREWVGTSTDIDDQKKAELTLRNTAAELEERVAERTRSLQELVSEMNTFTYSVSHDLQAPLRGIQGYAEALVDDFGDCMKPEGHRYVNQIIASSRHMSALITDLLTLSRLGREEMVLEPIDLPAVASGVLAQLHDPLRRRGAVVENAVPNDLPKVVGQSTIAFQVLFNLVSNALKFVPGDRAPRIRITSEDRGDRVRLWIEDNGIGIAPHHHGRIFQVFERLHQAHVYPGTGIGLAIAQKAAERMNGSIGLESTPGVGSRFWFELTKSGPEPRVPARP